MNVLVLGGTRYFGIPMVEKLLKDGHKVTIATRQSKTDPFGNRVERVKVDRTNPESMQAAFKGKKYDVVIDKLGYCSNDIKYLMESMDFDKYLYTSSASIYDPKVVDTKEDSFDGISEKTVWCDRGDYPYNVIKKYAEMALWQEYAGKNWIAVRYPFVVSKDDYTKRIQFYVSHAMNGIPMNIDNLDSNISFVDATEAGEFLAYLVDKDFNGAVNGCSDGTVTIREIINYVEQKTGAKAIITPTGEPAPYNGEPNHSLNTDKAKQLGFSFSNLRDWIWDLLDFYIAEQSGYGTNT